jgi:hypothetical protein
VQVVFEGALGEQDAVASCSPIDLGNSSLASGCVRLLLAIVKMELRQPQRSKPLCPYYWIATTGRHDYQLPRIDECAQVRHICQIGAEPPREPGQKLNVVCSFDDQKQTCTTMWLERTKRSDWQGKQSTSFGKWPQAGRPG